MVSGIRFHPLRLYAFSELLIAVSALVVPLQLVWGNHLLGRMADRVPISSGTYYLVSGAWLALTLVPWCACMGATIPLAMFAIRSDSGHDSRRSFSFLYLANVLGAVAGAIIPLLLIELYGFHGTLRIGAVLNTLIFAAAFGLTLASPAALPAVAAPTQPKAFGPCCKQHSHPAASVHHRPDHHGHGGHLDPAVYRLHRSGSLLLCHNPGRVPGGYFRGLAGVPHLEPSRHHRENRSALGFAGLLRPAAAADRRWPAVD